MVDHSVRSRQGCFRSPRAAWRRADSNLCDTPRFSVALRGERTTRGESKGKGKGTGTGKLRRWVSEGLPVNRAEALRVSRASAEDAVVWPVGQDLRLAPVRDVLERLAADELGEAILTRPLADDEVGRARAGEAHHGGPRRTAENRGDETQRQTPSGPLVDHSVRSRQGCFRSPRAAWRRADSNLCDTPRFSVALRGERTTRGESKGKGKGTGTGKLRRWVSEGLPVNRAEALRVSRASAEDAVVWPVGQDLRLAPVRDVLERLAADELGEAILTRPLADDEVGRARAGEAHHGGPRRTAEMRRRGRHRAARWSTTR